MRVIFQLQQEFIFVSSFCQLQKQEATERPESAIEAGKELRCQLQLLLVSVSGKSPASIDRMDVRTCGPKCRAVVIVTKLRG